MLTHLLTHHRVSFLPRMRSLNPENRSHPLSHRHIMTFLFRSACIAHLCPRGGSSSCWESVCWLNLLASSYLLRQIGSVICSLLSRHVSCRTLVPDLPEYPLGARVEWPATNLQKNLKLWEEKGVFKIRGGDNLNSENYVLITANNETNNRSS